MISLQNVTKRYGRTTVLDQASYTFPQKGLVCVIGPSGGGKTTLLNLIAGFDTQYEGRISAGGLPLSGMTADELCRYRRDHVGFIFQNYHLLPGYSVLENVLLPSELSGKDPQECERRAKDLLFQLGLSDKAGQKAETLSGGQKQRAAIARALLCSPQVLLADEPTGALDRAASSEIMELLRDISREKLVVVITHDARLLPFADEVLRLEDGRIVSEQDARRPACGTLPASSPKGGKTAPWRRAAKNFRVHGKRYLAVAAAISIGLTAFLLSLSSGSVMQNAIEAFQQKNTVYANGCLKDPTEEVQELLRQDSRVEHVFLQYPLSGASLTLDGRTETLAEKLPLPKTAESLSYGVMPRRGEDEIALSPSLAKKFSGDLQALLGRPLTLALNGNEYPLTVSGIYNAGYDDFFVSPDVEESLYGGRERETPYSISYDVKEFEDITAVSRDLQARGLSPQDAAKEVDAMLATFHSLSRLFLTVSVLVLLAAVSLCAVLLVRLQASRSREMGLLAALGFRRKEIGAVIREENLLLACLAAVSSVLLLCLAGLVFHLSGFPLSIGLPQFAASIGAAFLTILGVSAAASFRLLRTDPAEALRK